MRLYAISDLHLSFKGNRDALSDLDPHIYLNDGLIICGDVGEKAEHLDLAFKTATATFKQVFWVPGNHELYTMHSDADGPKGEDRYMACVKVAREWNVKTPEDDFVIWEGDGGPCIIALIFTLYDYSFRPEHISREDAVKWAEEEGVLAIDEILLHPHPYSTRDAWCEALCQRFENKLQDAMAKNPGIPTILVNHWPLRQDLVKLWNIPRFSIWCGTIKTEQWHTKFNAKVVVSGHLHVRRTDWIDGVRFEECSLGYPRQWKEAEKMGCDINQFLREILPGPAVPEGGIAPTVWRRFG